jgi:hypothetical protein
VSRLTDDVTEAAQDAAAAADPGRPRLGDRSRDEVLVTNVLVTNEDDLRAERGMPGHLERHMAPCGSMMRIE